MVSGERYMGLSRWVVIVPRLCLSATLREWLALLLSIDQPQELT